MGVLHTGNGDRSCDNSDTCRDCRSFVLEPAIGFISYGRFDVNQIEVITRIPLQRILKCIEKSRIGMGMVHFE